MFYRVRLPFSLTVMYKMMYIIGEVIKMTTKIRKQIYINPEQQFFLKRVSNNQKISEAEIIRLAIDRYAQAYQMHNSNQPAWESERAYIEQLIALGSVSGGRQWSRDDLYDE